MIDPDHYKPTRPMMGVWLLFRSRQRYVDAAVEHVVWLDLQADDLRRKYLEGRYLPESDDTRSLEAKRLESLRGQLWRSLGQVAGAATIAFLIGIGNGTVGVDLPLHPGKAFGFIGTFLVAWAALFELGGLGLASWDGETLSEIVHPKLFQILFIPGTLAVLCSILL